MLFLVAAAAAAVKSYNGLRAVLDDYIFSQGVHKKLPSNFSSI